MHPWLDFGTCFEVDDERIELALAPAVSLEDDLPRERVFALLDRMVEVARPRQGAARILFVLARLARCDWLEGILEVDMRATATGTTIDLRIDDGLVRTRLRPSLELAVPLAELEVGVERAAALVAPLVVHEAEEGKRLLLSASAQASQRDLQPAAEVGALGMAPGSKSAGWGAPPDAKPTLKVEAIQIPPEAYRDPPPQQAGEIADKPTVRPAAPVTQPGVDAGSPKTEEIDGEW